MKTYAAFDIGTCTTVCAYLQDIDGEGADSSVLRTTGGTGLYPSLVAFPKGKKPLVGADAEKYLAEGNTYIAMKAKRDIGKDICYSTPHGPKEPAQIQALIGRSVMGDLLNLTNLQESDIITAFTYPIGFNGKELEEYKRGLESEGFRFDHRMFFSEPLAAMMAVAHEVNEDPDGKTMMIVDIGGGTTDILVGTCRSEGDMFIVCPRGTGADTSLGGADFDECIRKIVVDRITDVTGITSAQIESDSKKRYDVSRNCEDIKINKLCRLKKDATFAINLRGVDKPVSGTVQWADYVEKTKGLVDRICDECDKALSRAVNDNPENLEKLKIDALKDASEVDYVVFIGGGSKVPMIKDELIRRHPYFAGKIVDDNLLDPQFAVALGASYLAHIMDRGGEPGPSGDETPTGWTPWGRSECAYGVQAFDIQSGKLYCSVHIYENDVLPTEEVRTYRPINEGNYAFNVPVFKVPGWTRKSKGDCPLDRCTTLGYIKTKAHDFTQNDKIIVTFTMNHNQTVDVKAKIGGIEEDCEFEYADSF